MIIVRTFDSELITSIVTDESIYDHISDDGSAGKYEYAPNVSESVYWLAPFDGEILGVFMVHAVNYITCEIHTCLLHKGRGKKAKEAANAVVKWIFDNTGFAKIITFIPSFNIAAKRLAESAGMIHEGVNRCSFMKNNKIYDQFLYGIIRGDVCQQQQ